MSIECEEGFELNGHLGTKPTYYQYIIDSNEKQKYAKCFEPDKPLFPTVRRKIAINLEKQYQQPHNPRNSESSSRNTPTDEHSFSEEDFVAYQNADLAKFFSETVLGPAHSISDICLVNDHHILVKMLPESEASCASEGNVSEKSSKARIVHVRKIVDSNSSCTSATNKKKKTCFMCKRNSKITPVEEEIKHISHTSSNETSQETCIDTTCSNENLTKPKASSIEVDALEEPKVPLHQALHNKSDLDVEVFESVTRIKSRCTVLEPKICIIDQSIDKTQPTQYLCKTTANSESSTSSSPALNNKSDSSDKPTPKRKKSRKKHRAPLCPAQQNLTGKALQTSVTDAVRLQTNIIVHTAEDTSCCDAKTSTAATTTATADKSEQTGTKFAQPKFSIFRWLCKPFRRTTHKVKKSEKKIDAVVYKTYFISWIRPASGANEQCGPHIKDNLTMKRSQSMFF